MEPEFRVTVNRAELKALTRAVESIERGLAREDREGAETSDGTGLLGSPAGEPGSGHEAKITAPDESGRRSADSSGRESEPAGAPKRARIVAAFFESRGASSNAEIAAEVGANEGYVSRVLKPIRDEFREMNRDERDRKSTRLNSSHSS